MSMKLSVLRGFARLRRPAIVALGCGLALCLTASSAQATSLIFDLDFEFSGATEPEGAGPWVRITFDDNTGDPNSVNLTIDAIGLTGTETLASMYLNFDEPPLDPTLLTFNVIDNSASIPTSINTGANLFQADGDGLFDIDFEFPPPPGSPFSDRLTAGESVIYELVYPSAIDASSFDFLSEMGGGAGSYFAAAHIQSIGVGSESGWIGAAGPVPEPTTGLMIGLGLLLGSRVARRR